MEGKKTRNYLRIPLVDILDGGPVRLKEIIDGLSKYKSFQVDKVIYASQVQNSKSFTVTFDESLNARHFFGKTIQLREKEIKIDDPIADWKEYKLHKKLQRQQQLDFNIYKHNYKLMWLPHQFPQATIKKFFEDRGYEVNEIVEEYSREFPTIKNGNLIVKTYREGAMTDSDFVKSGIFEIFDKGFPRQRRCIIKMFGEKPRCLICGSFEHLRKFCPMINSECTKCKKKGHTTEMCSISTACFGAKSDDFADTPEDEDEDINHDMNIGGGIINNQIVLRSNEVEEMITNDCENSEENSMPKIVNEKSKVIDRSTTIETTNNTAKADDNISVDTVLAEVNDSRIAKGMSPIVMPNAIENVVHQTPVNINTEKKRKERSPNSDEENQTKLFAADSEFETSTDDHDISSSNTSISTEGTNNDLTKGPEKGPESV